MTDPRWLSTIELLQGARALLTPPQNWTQGYSARKADGTEAVVTTDEAVCWCLSGALEWAYQVQPTKRSDFNDARFHLRREIIASTMHAGIVSFNDAPDRKHHEVLAALDRTIERLQKP